MMTAEQLQQVRRISHQHFVNESMLVALYELRELFEDRTHWRDLTADRGPGEASGLGVVLVCRSGADMICTHMTMCECHDAAINKVLEELFRDFEDRWEYAMSQQNFDHATVWAWALDRIKERLT